MDNEGFLAQSRNLENREKSFSDFPEIKKGETLVRLANGADDVLPDSGEMVKEKRSMVMPPDNNIASREVPGDAKLKMIADIGSDGKISAGEFSSLKAQVINMSDDPAELNDAIQGLSEKMIGGKE